MHDEEFTRMSTMGFTSQLTKLDKRFGEQEPHLKVQPTYNNGT